MKTNGLSSSWEAACSKTYSQCSQCQRCLFDSFSPRWDCCCAVSLFSLSRSASPAVPYHSPVELTTEPTVSLSFMASVMKHWCNGSGNPLVTHPTVLNLVCNKGVVLRHTLMHRLQLWGFSKNKCERKKGIFRNLISEDMPQLTALLTFFKMFKLFLKNKVSRLFSQPFFGSFWSFSFKFFKWTVTLSPAARALISCDRDPPSFDVGCTLRGTFFYSWKGKQTVRNAGLCRIRSRCK